MSEDSVNAPTLRAEGRPIGPRPAELGRTERYQVGAVLGRGGMGEVRACDDLRLGRSIAMKRASGGSEIELLRFVREAQVQGQLQHPSIVPVHELGVGEDGAPFFTMKRVQGDTLAAIIGALQRGESGAKERWPQRKLLQAFSRVCEAVEFAHSSGWLHRDLKPANMMLGEYGEVYVLDWGLARRLDAASARVVEPLTNDAAITMPGDLLGTPGYMPPEQAMGEALDARSDVYALGAVLFELLSGERLAPGESSSERLLVTRDGVDARVRSRAPAAEVAPELEAICVTATRRAPADRFPSVRALIDALDRALAGEQDSALRAALAQAHTVKAREAIRAAAEPNSDELSLRRVALRELGRSLALDPSNAEALKAMLQLLAEPPVTVPAEARARLEQSARAATQRVAVGGAISFAVALAPLLPAFTALRDGWLVAAVFLTFAMAPAPSIALSVLRKPPRFLFLGSILLSNVAVASLYFVTGPLIALPATAVANVSGFAIGLNQRWRWFAFAVGLLAFALPLAGALTGVLPPTMRFVPEGLLLVPLGMHFEPAATIAVVLGYFGASMLSPILVIGYLRDQNRAHERRRELQAWQLEQMVPPSTITAT